MEDGSVVARASFARAAIARGIRKVAPDIPVEDLWGTRLAWLVPADYLHAPERPGLTETRRHYLRLAISQSIHGALHGNAAMVNFTLAMGALHQTLWDPRQLPSSPIPRFPTYRELSHETVRVHVRNALAHMLFEGAELSRPESEPTPKTFSDFLPSGGLLDLVREGIRAHSQGYTGIIDPTFVSVGSMLFSEHDLREFLAVRMWRLMLTLADDAIAEGLRRVEVADPNGFTDQIDLMVLERVPVPPKKISNFLRELYNEYQVYASPNLELPDRGVLRSIDGHLWIELKMARDPETSLGEKAIVSFE